MLVKRLVLAYALRNLFHRIVDAAHNQRLLVACSRALSAVVADGPVNMYVLDVLLRRSMTDPLSGGYGSSVTRRQTLSAFSDPRTPHCHPAQLLVKLLRVGTVTPRAAQGASLQKNGRADPGPILYGKTLDGVDFTGQRFFH